MYPNSCIAFTGPFGNLWHCSECSEPQYDPKKPGLNVPLKHFYTIPLGPQIQAQWQAPEGADQMCYQNHRTAAIIARLNNSPGQPID